MRGKNFLRSQNVFFDTEEVKVYLFDTDVLRAGTQNIEPLKIQIWPPIYG